MKPKVILPFFPGTNCHHEMAHAFALAGAEPEIVLLSSLVVGRRRLTDADLIGLAGGFSFGDHFGSGRVAAYELVHRFRDQLLLARERRIPMLGICNGFQILVAAGLLPGDGPVGEPNAILDLNLSAKFEHWGNTRVVLHEPSGINCVWTKGMDGVSMRLPVAHGEGRIVGDGKWSIVGTYGTNEGVAEYPTSPNGSPVAGICDPTGVIAGFMPHPERRVDELHGGSQGLLIYSVGVESVM